MLLEVAHPFAHAVHGAAIQRRSAARPGELRLVLLLDHAGLLVEGRQATPSQRQRRVLAALGGEAHVLVEVRRQGEGPPVDEGLGDAVEVAVVDVDGDDHGSFGRREGCRATCVHLVKRRVVCDRKSFQLQVPNFIKLFIFIFKSPIGN